MKTMMKDNLSEAEVKEVVEKKVTRTGAEIRLELEGLVEKFDVKGSSSHKAKTFHKDLELCLQKREYIPTEGLVENAKALFLVVAK